MGLRAPSSGVSTVLRPSGDATGATDIAAINQTLTNNSTVILHGGEFLTASAILVPSDRTLILLNANVRLKAGVNDNAIRNSDQTVSGLGNRNIRIVGIGRARIQNQTSTTIAASASSGSGTLALNGYLPAGSYIAANSSTTETVTITACTQATNSTWTATLSGTTTIAHSSGNGIYSNQGRDLSAPNPSINMFWVNVQDLVVENLTLGPAPYMNVTNYAVVNARYSRIHIGQDRSISNQDGLDIGPACQNITIEDVTGKTGDDCFSIFAKAKLSTNVNTTPYTNALTATQRSISDITIRNVRVDVGINPLRLQAGQGSTLSGVHASNIRSLSSAGHYPVVQMGPTSYLDSLSDVPASADISNIVLDGYVGAGDYVLACDTNFSDLTIRNVKVTGDSSTMTAIVGQRGGGIAGFNPSITDVYVNGVSLEGSSNGVSDILNYPSGSLNRAQISSVRVRKTNSVLNNAGTVTNLTLRDIHAVVLGSTPFKSSIAETGRVANVTCDVDSGTAHYTGAAFKLKASGDMPIVLSGDVTPSAATKGSRLTAVAAKQLDGGAGTVGAEWIANGSSWIKASDLGSGF